MHHVCMYLWRPEVDIRHLPLWLLTLILETGFLIELGDHPISRQADQWASGIYLSLNIINAGIMGTHCHTWLSHVLGIQTQVLILAWLVLYISPAPLEFLVWAHVLRRAWFFFLVSDLGVRVMLILKWAESNSFIEFFFCIMDFDYGFSSLFSPRSFPPPYPSNSMPSSSREQPCSLILCNSLCVFRTIIFFCESLLCLCDVIFWGWSLFARMWFLYDLFFFNMRQGDILNHGNMK